MKSALAIQCLPFGMNGKSEVYRVVDAAIAVIDRSGLEYTVGPFETVVEGPMDALYALARDAHAAMVAAGASSCASYLKIFSGADLGTSTEKIGKYRDAGH